MLALFVRSTYNSIIPNGYVKAKITASVQAVVNSSRPPAEVTLKRISCANKLRFQLSEAKGGGFRASEIETW